MAASIQLLSSCGRLGFSERGAADAGTRPRDAQVAPDASDAMDASALPDTGSPATAGASADAQTDAGGCEVQRALDYCEQLPALREEPVMDGQLDCGPELVDMPQRGWTGAGEPPANQRARYAVAWHPNGLYFYVEVDDPERLPASQQEGRPWCGDGVELYADADGRFSAPPGYDNPGTMQLLAAAPAQQPDAPRAPDVRFHTRSEAEQGAWSGARHGMWPRDGGYVLEGFVTAEDLDLPRLALAVGRRVGIDVGVNVSFASTDTPAESDADAGAADCALRAGQYFLRVASEPCSLETCRPYMNVGAFCTPMLRR